MRLRHLLPLVLVSTLLVGCVSTQDRYERGVAREADGRYADAAEAYLKVLAKEPGYEDTRQRLERVGQLVVDDYLDQAQRATQQGSFEEGVRALERLDDLRARAAAVDVRFRLPADYPGYRDEMTQSAIAQVISQGQRAEASGDWGAALAAYDRARTRYPLTDEQVRELDEDQARVLVRWAEADLADERFRAAFDRAGEALDRFGPDGPLAATARAVQDEALGAGTRFVAFLPLTEPTSVARATPRGFAVDLDDELRYRYWPAPPLFIESVDPVEVGRETRRLPVRRERISTGEAAAIGRAVYADYVVVLEVGAFEAEERDVEEELRPAQTRTRPPRDTSFVARRFRQVYDAELDYAIVEARTGAVVAEGTVGADVADRFERGVFAGDYGDLALRRADLSLFDANRHASEEQALTNELIARLAESLATEVFDDLLRHVP